MSIASLFCRHPHRDRARQLYAEIVAQSRRAVFFAACGVPDTLDGRFDLLALHAFLVLNRLKREHEESAEFAQELFDCMFTDMDRSLREMGVGDLAVGRHVKRMAKAFYGRIASYESGLAAEGGSLDEALRRNLYGTVTPLPRDVAAMAGYMRRCAEALDAQPAATLLAGTARFAALPSAPERAG
ncbi:MAG: ubiquinol-cytochrome C chaperone family protein [Alphaproteobacteria bacterium]|nr:ubiquinol-cytochrome C chaperone family protein [Alphaproteobacteria bacterium]